MSLSSWWVHNTENSLYWKEGVLRSFAIFFIFACRGRCIPLDLTISLSSHQLYVTFWKSSSSDIPMNLSSSYSLRSSLWAELDLDFMNFTQLCFGGFFYQSVCGKFVQNAPSMIFFGSALCEHVEGMLTILEFQNPCDYVPSLITDSLSFGPPKFVQNAPDMQCFFDNFSAILSKNLPKFWVRGKIWLS